MWSRIGGGGNLLTWFGWSEETMTLSWSYLNSDQKHEKEPKEGGLHGFARAESSVTCGCFKGVFTSPCTTECDGGPWSMCICVLEIDNIPSSWSKHVCCWDEQSTISYKTVSALRVVFVILHFLVLGSKKHNCFHVGVVILEKIGHQCWNVVVERRIPREGDWPTLLSEREPRDRY